MDQNKIVIGGAAAAGVVAIALVLANAGGQSENMQSSLNQAQTNSEATAATNVAPTQNAVAQEENTLQIENKYKKIMNATIKTSLGDISVELTGDKTPQTAGNFAKLAEEGFYNGIKFHRVINGFMIQGGDPLTKDDAQKAMWGTGDPGYKFNDEPFTGQYARGTLAMANSGPNTNGSQFFIMHQDTPLPPSYVIFGKVISGIEVVDKIAELEVDSRDCPLNPPVIESISIAR
jgi:cyclophilin family peptidyl-prolyl cis-trans isomerase